jgi:hypothetical protein
LTASAVRIDIGSDGEILPDSIQNLKSAVRTTTPNKSSNPVAGRIRNQRRDLILQQSRGDRTALELFVSAVQAWPDVIRRSLAAA